MEINLICCMLENRNGRHNYTALDHGPSVCENVGEYMEMEKRSRDRALSICQAYIRRTPRYSLVKQLNNLGKFLAILLSLCALVSLSYSWFLFISNKYVSAKQR